MGTAFSIGLLLVNRNSALTEELSGMQVLSSEYQAVLITETEYPIQTRLQINISKKANFRHILRVVCTANDMSGKILGNVVYKTH